MTGAGDRDVAALLKHIGRELPNVWTAWPGGWPDQVELALLDAVLSIRSRYGSPTTGVRRRVQLYRQHRGGDRADDLTVLAGTDTGALATLLQTQQRTGGVLKADAIVQAAVRLTKSVYVMRPTSTRSPLRRSGLTSASSALGR